MPAPDRNELHVHRLSCRRGGRQLFRALEFTAAPGMLVRVSGPNGAGKTTLLRILAGLRPPDDGAVHWNGEPVRHARGEAAIAWLGHTDGIKGELTPRENLRFHQALVALPDAASVETALARAGLADVADRACRFLSRGQRRRAALARLLLAELPLWLLDEPLAALDEQGQALVEELVGTHCERGGIVVLTSHQPFTVAGVECTEVALG